MERTNKKLRIIKVLLMLILILYFMFLYIDIFNVQMSTWSKNIKFLSMILVFIISLMIGKDYLNPRDSFLLKLGLGITLMADIFLLLLNDYYILGIVLFSIVQIIYCLRYRGGNNKIIIRNFTLIFLILISLYFAINQFIIQIDFLAIIAVFYAICLLTSTKYALETYKHKQFPKLNSKLIGLGMVLFLLCDINVAVFNITETIGTHKEFSILLNRISSVSMWFFYLPSQVLLALSGYKK